MTASELDDLLVGLDGANLDEAQCADLLDRLECDPTARRRLVEHWSESAALRQVLAAPRLRPRRRGRWFTAAAVAAAALVAITVAVWPVAGPQRESDSAALVDGPFRSATGESWRFADGSRVTTLDAATGTVAFAGGGAQIDLDRGTLGFDVRHQPDSRAWQVRCGDLAATVVGTRFRAVALADDATVLLDEGRLELSADASPATLTLEHGALATRRAGGAIRTWPAPVQQDLVGCVIPASGGDALDLLVPAPGRVTTVGKVQRDAVGNVVLERGQTLVWTATVDELTAIRRHGLSINVWLTPVRLSAEAWFPACQLLVPGTDREFHIGVPASARLTQGRTHLVTLVLHDGTCRSWLNGRPSSAVATPPMSDGSALAIAVGGAAPALMPEARWSLHLHRLDVHRRALTEAEIARVLAAGWR